MPVSMDMLRVFTYYTPALPWHGSFPVRKGRRPPLAHSIEISDIFIPYDRPEVLDRASRFHLWFVSGIFLRRSMFTRKKTLTGLSRTCG
jgi:hypothetical protein